MTMSANNRCLSVDGYIYWLQEVYVGVLMAMFAHPGLTEAGCVDTGILPVVKGLLRDGPW